VSSLPKHFEMFFFVFLHKDIDLFFVSFYAFSLGAN